MDKATIRKVTTLAFLGFAALSYIVVEILFRSMASAFGAAQRLYSIDVASHGIPIAAALLCFGLLQFNAKACVWAEEVIVEVSKVVWPSRKDTVGMTIVVCVMVFIASGILFLFDNVAREVVKFIVN